MSHKKGLYNKDFHPHQLKLLRVENLQDKEIYNKMGISYQTFYRWLKKYPEFKEAYDFGKTKIVSEGVSALLKRALGFEKEELLQEIEQDENGKTTRKHLKKTMKYYPPEPKLLTFLLTNLDPDTWKNLQNQKIEGNLKVEEQVDVSNLSKSALKELASLSIKKDEN